MNIKITTIIICFMVIINGCGNTPINELPMYGGIKRTPAEIESDNKLIETVTKNQTRQEASREAARLGWEYYHESDLKTAMKRFNQAWLLDPENPYAYWGFGLILAEKAQKKASVEMIDQAVQMLERTAELLPQNSRVFTDLALSYSEKGLYERNYSHEHPGVKRLKPVEQRNNKDGQGSFNRANDLFSQARQIKPDFGRLYYFWAVCLNYEEKNKEALSKIEEAKKFNFDVPKDFIEKVKRQLNEN